MRSPAKAKSKKPVRAAARISKVKSKRKNISRLAFAKQQRNLTDDYLDNLFAYMPGNIYWMDKNSIYLGCNENTAKTCGFKSRKEIIGKTYKDFAELAHWDKGQGDSFRADDKKILETGLPIFNKEEPPIPDINGKLVYFLTSRMPLRDKAGNIIGVVGVSIDITERKKMEQELKEAKEKAEAALRAKEIAEAESREKSVVLEDVLQDLKLDRYRLIDENRTVYLSHREAQCMLCLTHGMSAKQTAKALKLSSRTIEFYLGRLKNKLHCEDRSQLIAKAMSCRFLEGIYAGSNINSVSLSQRNISNKFSQENITV